MQTACRTWILFLLIWFAVVLSSGSGVCANPLVIENEAACDLGGHLEILHDESGTLTVQQAAHRTDWSGPLRDNVPNLGLTRSAVWLRFTLNNRSGARRNFFISFEYPVTNSVTFYYEEPQGVFREERAGSTVPSSENVVPDRHFVFPLLIGPQATSTVYMKIRSRSGMSLPVRVLSTHGLSRKAIQDYTVYGALLGFLVLVLVYFVVMTPFLYKGTALWLSFYSIFFGMHTAVRGGFLRLMIPDSAAPMTNLIQLLIIGGLFFTGAKFYRSFLSLKNHSKALDVIMIFFQYLSLVFVAFSLAQISSALTAISLLLFVVNPIFSVSLAFYFWRKGVGNAGCFAMGWVVAHSVAVYDFFRINGVLPYPVFGDWLIPLSFFIAFLFLSVALIRQNVADHLMAETDPLTYLANRRKFDEALHNEWNRCRRLSSPLSLILADVDHFKRYNDTYGHRAGDHCLCRIADILKEYTRRTGDLAVRYGGEEFVLLLPNVDAEGAFSLAETIRKTVEGSAKEGERHRPNEKITISLGVAAKVPDAEEKPENLILEADKALYEAKRAGRNCTVGGASVEREKGDGSIFSSMKK